MSRRLWSDMDTEILSKLYATTPTENIARGLGCSVDQVWRKAQSMGLRKSLELIAETSRRNMLDPKHPGRAHQFQPGIVPANKGIKRPGWAPGRMAETQFKAGRPAHEAPNYLPIGATKLSDGYLVRKVTDDQSIAPARRWIAEHRLVWESAHGPIPAGHVVVFRPGMHTTDLASITLDRLELVTRAELMRRNTIHRYPEQLKQVIRLRSRLGRAIRKHEEQGQ